MSAREAVAGTETEPVARKVLVTGGDGFVGEHLIAHLLEAGHRVAASALSLPPDRDTLSPEQMGAVEWKVADVLDRDALYRLVAAIRPDHIFHLAGMSSAARARERPAEAVRTNAAGTVNLLEAIVAAREDFPGLDPRILVMGSGDAYGRTAADGEPVAEDQSLRPLGPYGLSKACQEIAAHTYRRSHGLRTLVARPFNLVGPGQRPGFVVPDFCARVSAVASGRDESPLRVGTLDVERDFTDVRDAVRAFRRVMELPEPAVVYNVCSGVPLAIGRLLDWVLEEAGVEVEVQVDPALAREDEPARIVGDPGRLVRDTGWEPAHELRDTVRETYRWTAKIAA